MVKKVPPKYANLGMHLIVSYSPPEDKISAWHTVSPQRESFLKIAARYSVPVARLIEFNFPGSVKNDRVNPDVVNWYLFNHERFQCRKTTADGMNYTRLFSVPMWGAVACLAAMLIFYPGGRTPVIEPAKSETTETPSRIVPNRHRLDQPRNVSAGA